MSTTRPQNPVSRLNPISDADAARAASPQTLADLAAAIVATPAPPKARRGGLFGGSSRSVRRPVLTLAVAAGVLAALVLGVTGVLSGQGPTAPQLADAGVLRGAAAALAHPPGSIVIDFDSNVQKTNPKFLKFAPGFKPPEGIQTGRWSNHEITETPVGRGPQNEVNLGGPVSPMESRSARLTATTSSTIRPPTPSISRASTGLTSPPAQNRAPSSTRSPSCKARRLVQRQHKRMPIGRRR